MRQSVKLLPLLTITNPLAQNITITPRVQSYGPCSRSYQEMQWGTSDMQFQLSGRMIHEVTKSAVEARCASDPACIGYTKSWNLANKILYIKTYNH